MARSFVAVVTLVALMLVNLAGVSLPAGTQAPPAAQASSHWSWSVAITIHEIRSITNDDAWGDDDIYWRASITPTFGAGETRSCSSFAEHPEDERHIFPEQSCTATPITGGDDTTVQIVLAAWEHDSTSADDHFDIHPHPDARDLVIAFKPATHEVSIEGVPGWEDVACGAGTIRTRGLNGDDQAEIVFSVNASLAGAPDGDSDGDGLPDGWEICGYDSNGDGVVDVDLPAMGANPYRADVFVEIDWMVDDDGTPDDHSHEPWLPSMVNAWNELNAAPVANPTVDGVPAPTGIALHVDVGTLYAGYTLDFHGDGINEYTVGPAGNLDLDGDGIPDIGNLGGLGIGTAGGGNRLPEMTLLSGPGGVADETFADGSTFQTLKAANFDTSRDRIFRYAIFAHQFLADVGTGTPVTNFSGVAECVGACNDFTVTLGTVGSQAQDTDFDGVSDTLPLLLGPSGLPVSGFVFQHTAVFLHELGHTIGLGHGGDGHTNRKPNYLSTMNYSFMWSGIQFDTTGDLFGDVVGVDFDGDGIQDIRRHMFSDQDLPDLNEANLSEPAGIGDDQPSITTFGPIIDTDGDGVCDVCAQSALGNGPIDWSRGDGQDRSGDGIADDGDGNALNDINVSQLTSPPNPAGTPTDLNRDGAQTVLSGFDDYLKLQTNGVSFNTPDNDLVPVSSWDDERYRRENTIRIVQLPDEATLIATCDTAPSRITFEEFPLGTEVDDEYADLAQFLNDDARTPVIIGPNDRNGQPTQSPDQSLVNRTNPVFNEHPLVIELTSPQRMVGFYLGQITGGPAPGVALSETGHYLGLDFRDSWRLNGGLPVFGYPITAEYQEPNADTGREHTVQFTERQRLEWHPEHAGTPYHVLLGRLGDELLRQQGRDWTEFARADPAAPHYVAETGHAIAPEFWAYWSSHGLEIGDPAISFRESLALFGLPLSEPMTETNVDGHTVLTQYFERAVLEHHPDNPEPYRVLLRRLGAELLLGRGWSTP